MPSGKTHLKATLALGVVSFLFCSRYGYSQLHTVGVLTGALVTPDLDVDGGMYSNHIIRSVPIVGRWLEPVWAWYWRPYTSIAKHRQLVSHSYGVSTLIRIVYIGWWYFLLPMSVLYYAFVVGLMAADALHITLDLLDEIFTETRRYFRSHRR